MSTPFFSDGGGSTGSLGVLWSDELSPLVQGVTRLQAAFRGHSCRRRLRKIPAREVERAVRQLQTNEKGCKRLIFYMCFIAAYFGAVIIQTDTVMQGEVELGLRQFTESVTFDNGNRDMFGVANINDFFLWTKAFYLAAYQGKQPEDVCNICYMAELSQKQGVSHAKLSDLLAPLLTPADCWGSCIDSETGWNETLAANLTVRAYNLSSKQGEYFTYSCLECEPLLPCFFPPCGNGNPNASDFSVSIADEAVTAQNGYLPSSIQADEQTCVGRSWLNYGLTRNSAELLGGSTINITDGLGYIALNRVIGGLMVIWDRRDPQTCLATKIEDPDFYEPCYTSERNESGLLIGNSSSIYLPSATHVIYDTNLEGHVVLLDLGLFNIGLAYGYCTLVALEADGMIGHETGSATVRIATYNGNGRTKYATSEVRFRFHLGGQVEVTPLQTSFVSRQYVPPQDKNDALRISFEITAVVLIVLSVVHDYRKRLRRKHEQSRAIKAAYKAAIAAMSPRRGAVANLRPSTASLQKKTGRKARLWRAWKRAKKAGKLPHTRKTCGPSCFCGCLFHFMVLTSMVFWIFFASLGYQWTLPTTLEMKESDGQQHRNSPLLTKVAKAMTSIQNYADLWQAYGEVFLLAALLALGRFFHIVRFHRRLSLVSDTLRNSAQHLFHFLLVFFAVVLIYALASYTALGESLDAYSSLAVAVFTQLRIALGESDELYPSIVDARPVVGLLLVLTYQMLIGLLMLNVLIAIAIDAHHEYVDALQHEETVWESIKAFVGVVAMRFLHSCRRRRRRLKMFGRGGSGSGDESDATSGAGGNRWWQWRRRRRRRRRRKAKAGLPTTVSPTSGEAPVAVPVSEEGGGGSGAALPPAPQRPDSGRHSSAPSPDFFGAFLVIGTDGEPVRMIHRITAATGSETRLSKNCPRYLDCFAVRDLIAAGTPAPNFLANRYTRKILSFWMFESTEQLPEEHPEKKKAAIRRAAAAAAAAAGGAGGGGGGGGSEAVFAAARSLAAGRAAYSAANTHKLDGGCADVSRPLRHTNSQDSSGGGDGFMSRQLRSAVAAVVGVHAFAERGAAAARQREEEAETTVELSPAASQNVPSSADIISEDRVSGPAEPGLQWSLYRRKR